MNKGLPIRDYEGTIQIISIDISLQPIQTLVPSGCEGHVTGSVGQSRVISIFVQCFPNPRAESPIVIEDRHKKTGPGKQMKFEGSVYEGLSGEELA